MMNWWLDRGVAGFRMDVIDLIGKDPDAGITADGPDLHPFLREMHDATLKGRDVVTVGEAWSATTEGALLYSGRDAGELSMVFQFAHIVQGWDEVHGKWKPKPFDLVGLKRVLAEWQLALAKDGWNSLFWSNHDLPRAVSKYGDDGRFRVVSAKMLATVLHMMKGTPYIYQGEEIGMTNIAFTDISQFRDIETLNFHKIQTAAGGTPGDFLAGANSNGRDNARTPMQWTDGPQAGFTSGEPWIEVNPNHREINVAADRARPDGIFAHYRELARLRRELAVMREGSFAPYLQDHPKVMAYVRQHEDARIAVLANFTGEVVTVDVPRGLAISGRAISANYPGRDALDGTAELRPFEAVAILEG